MLKRWKHKQLKMIWNLNFSKNINFFQKVKNLFWWNILKQHAQWFSCKVVLSYFNKIWTSKICSMVKRLSNPMHAGGSSSFNKKEWVKKEWPMCNWAITVSSFLFFRGQDIHSFNTGNILAQCSSSSLSCISPCTYISTSGFTSFFNLSITMMGIFIFYSPPPPPTGCTFISHFLPCKTTVKELEQEITATQPTSISLFVWSQSVAIFEQSHSVASWWHQC